MRRADRLFSLIQLLRGRSTATARELAELLEVSERTVYRDVADLIASGVPIQGEAGVGYRLSPSFDLPPLMFTEEELEALVFGARLVSAWADPELARAARSCIQKVQAAVPRAMQRQIGDNKLFSMNFRPSSQQHEKIRILRKAISNKLKLRIRYIDRNDQGSLRDVRPLSLFFVAPEWLLTTWCELRSEFRNFRVDRVLIEEHLEPFSDEEGKTIEDFFYEVRGA